MCGDLRSVALPQKMKATLLQQFDSFPQGLQVMLKKVSPLQNFSEGMVVHLGLAENILPLISLFLAAAVEEGILEELAVVPLLSPSSGQPWTRDVMRVALRTSTHSPTQRISCCAQQTQFANGSSSET